MYNYKKSIAVTGLGLLFSLGACTSRYEEYNQNPYGATKTQMARDSYSFRSAILNGQGWIIPLNPNTSQFTECLLGGSYGGYLADSNNGFNGKNFPQFNPAEDWNKVLFEDLISKVFINYNEVKSSTLEPVPLAIALVNKVMGMHRIVDAYGPIPYSKIGSEQKIQAPYDSQEQAYDTMFAELDEAIKVLTENLNSNISPDADRIYGGVVTKWLRLANSLKLRLAIRISHVAPDKAKLHAESALSHQGGVLETNADNAFYTPAATNPFYVVMYQWNDGDSRVSADITSYMNGYKDPRRERMFTISSFTSQRLGGEKNGFIGLRNGVQIPGDGSEKLYTNYKLTPQSPILWMNAAEVAFLRAEAALNNWNVGGKTAQQYYENGIRLSFGQWEATGVEEYLKNNTDVPSVHKDPVNASFSYTGATSLAKIAWDEASDRDTKIEQIITQKWIANFPLGLEAWSEYRRTGYPRLMPSPVNHSNGVVGDRGARRLAYPQTERGDNAENYADAVSKYLQGPDNMGTDVWWAKRVN